MATRKKAEKKASYKTKRPDVSRGELGFCSTPEVPEREFPSGVNPNRASLILNGSKKWTNGTQLHYYFFDRTSDGEFVELRNGSRVRRTWTANNAQKDVVRAAFEVWGKVDLGLEFIEVDSRNDAEIRIGFMRGDGAWSYVDRDILGPGRNERTMNLGWDIRGDIDTAVHEIGHTLGFPHEHQNPNAGIVWNEEKVYAELAGSPNFWPRDKTFHNIIHKLSSAEVAGSPWDPNSIMHYPFGPGLIKEPAPFGQTGLSPDPGLSARDKTWVAKWYPPLSPQNPELKAMHSQTLRLGPGEQKNFVVKPAATRQYNFSTFGTSDSVMVLFEKDGDDLRYLTADDDSGEDYNASFRARLIKGRTYVLRIRLYWSESSGETAVMMW
jgi:hypothetical protein